MQCFHWGFGNFNRDSRVKPQVEILLTVVYYDYVNIIKAITIEYVETLFNSVLVIAPLIILIVKSMS